MPQNGSRKEGPDLGPLLRAHGRRSTHQRLGVYAALAGRLDHPTAERLYREVRRRMPGLSLATVYKTLEVLVGIGAAGRLTDSDGTWRYDARADLHDHRRCLRCNRLEDVAIRRRRRRPAGDAGPGFRITGYRIEFLGHCVGCSEKDERARNPAHRRGESR